MKTSTKKNTNTKNKKDKKNNKVKPERKKINWPPIIIAIAVIAVGCGLFFGIKAGVRKAHEKDLDVAFYEVPDSVREDLEERFTKAYSGKINFVDISNDNFDARRIAKKYDLFFSWNGSAVTKLERYAEDIPLEWFSGMPTSIRRKAGKALPILLDHYEVAYYSASRLDAGLNYPQNISELDTYLKKMKGYTFSPFFCAGSDDDVLLALVSAMVEAFGGAKSYNILLDNLKKKGSLSLIIDMELSTTGKAEDAFTLRSILDMFRNWQTSGMVHPNWFIARQGDVEAFIEDNQVAILFTPLTTHRKMKYKQISKFDADRMPVFSFDIPHGVIAPELVGLKLTELPYFDSLLAELVKESVQKELSNKTKLGPVDARSQAYDRQADDVRFLAAACSEGPLPPLGIAVYQTNKNGKHNFAEEVRYYLKSGVTRAEIK